MDIDTPLIEGNCWVHIPTILKNYEVQKRLGESYWIIVAICLIPMSHIRTTINMHYKKSSLNE